MTQQGQSAMCMYCSRVLHAIIPSGRLFHHHDGDSRVNLSFNRMSIMEESKGFV